MSQKRNKLRSIILPKPADGLYSDRVERNPKPKKGPRHRKRIKK